VRAVNPRKDLSNGEGTCGGASACRRRLSPFAPRVRRVYDRAPRVFTGGFPARRGALHSVCSPCVVYVRVSGQVDLHHKPEKRRPDAQRKGGRSRKNRVAPALAGVAAVAMSFVITPTVGALTDACHSHVGRRLRWYGKAFVAAAKKRGHAQRDHPPGGLGQYGNIIKGLLEEVRDQGQLRQSRRHEPGRDQCLLPN